jgi:tubulin-specific chaperone B
MDSASAPDYRPPMNVAEVRNYVCGASAGQNRAADTVLLRVKHNNLRAEFPELRLSRSMQIDDLKAKLYIHVGTRPAFMRVLLVHAGAGESNAVALADEHRVLGYYSPAPQGDTLLVYDDDPHSASKGGWLEDTSLVEKYRISDEDYAKRPDTYVSYKDKMRQSDANWTMNSALANARGETVMADIQDVDLSAESPEARVGDRVEVTPGGKRGVVMYIGRDLQGLPPGWWLGVFYDEPVGKNDGEVKGVRYFDAPSNHGSLVRPRNAKVGDFPPEDDFDEDDDEI